MGTAGYYSGKITVKLSFADRILMKSSFDNFFKLECAGIFFISIEIFY